MPRIPQTLSDGCTEDETIAAARARDIMRDELYVNWVAHGKKGENPDEMDRETLASAYASLSKNANSVSSR